MTSQLELLGELLSIAVKQLAEPAEQVLQKVPLMSGEAPLVTPFIAFEEADPSPSPVEEAGAFGAWIIFQKPFPKDNREIGYRFMCTMLEYAEKPWLQPAEDGYAIETMIENLETGMISEAEFADWVCLRVAVAESLTA
jgi:hypothetical protein